ncbi:MAG: serine hydrolase [Candidatus Pacebacteria bacterium]|nr:serine hydrolase [Candidatus Paceibacterota bacterium]
MTSRTKIFLIALALSLPIFWGINALEKDLSNFFFWYALSEKPDIFLAQIAPKEYDLKPSRNEEMPNAEIVAKSAVSILINNEGREKTLFEKDIDTKLPFASLAKLMTAYVVLENYDLSKEITVSKEAVSQEGNFGKLEVGNVFTTEYLLYPLLMESSNDAAFALADDYGDMTERKFVELMKEEAQKLGMADTFFDNPTGLDPEESKTELNYSTANDLLKLAKKLLEKPLVWKILSTPKYSLYGPQLVNTNEFLFDGTGVWDGRIVGGKTGYTEMAGGCMLLVLNAPKNEGLLINIILGANGTNDRFKEMEKLVDWINSAYNW